MQVARMMMMTGWPLEQVVGLDVLTFNAMIATMTKVRYFDKAEDAWTAAIATGAGMSGKTDNLKKRTEEWMTLGEEDTTEKLAFGKKSASQFLKDFKLGKGGKI